MVCALSCSFYGLFLYYVKREAGVIIFLIRIRVPCAGCFHPILYFSISPGSLGLIVKNPVKFIFWRHSAINNYNKSNNINISSSYYSVCMRSSGDKSTHTGWNKPFSVSFIPLYQYRHRLHAFRCGQPRCCAYNKQFSIQITNSCISNWKICIWISCTAHYILIFYSILCCNWCLSFWQTHC